LALTFGPLAIWTAAALWTDGFITDCPTRQL